jgi:dihydrodipicolinate synthase/N-acetylneuraminate lyase
MTADEIRGTWATVLTPFRDDDSLNLDALEVELDAIVAAQPQGIYSHGTAGEFFNQTEEEWDAVTAAVARRSEAASIPFQLGASHQSPVVALDRVRRAAELEPSAIQVILPDWLGLNRDEIRSVIGTYGDAARDIGLVFYNPPHAKNLLSASQLDELTAEFPTIVGVKMADGDDAWGHRSVDAPEWGLGVERKIAAFLDEAIAPLVAKSYSNVTLDKTLAAAGGHLGDVGRVRWPHATATPEEVARVRDAANRLLPESLRPAV